MDADSIPCRARVSIEAVCWRLQVIAKAVQANGNVFVFELDLLSIVPQAAQMDCTGPF